MLDNLRDSASSSPFFEQEEELPDFLEETSPAPKKTRKKSKQFLGLTPPQRFVLATMLFVTVCLLGAMLLMVLGKVVLPL